MNFLNKIININKRNINLPCRYMGNTFVSEILSERSLIKVQGDECVQFLQGLITNDMAHFNHGAQSIYTMFLNKSGRVLNDSIIYRTSENNQFYIETDKMSSDNLCKHLRLFRVRRKINIEQLDTDYKICVLFQNIDENENNTKEMSLKAENDFKTNNFYIYSDPRVKSLGIRLILSKQLECNELLSKAFPSINIQSSTNDNGYKLHRYKLGIGEGLLDHQYGKILPFETNIDYLHGISFHKGCYLGQEVTARTYHTGVIRKRLMPIKLSKSIHFPSNHIDENKTTEVQTLNGISCGKIRGIKNDYCIAVLHVDRAVQSDKLLINGESCTLIVPNWWPKELPSKMKLKEKQS